jgi:two-component system response regulator PilR (NtrC family)
MEAVTDIDGSSRALEEVARIVPAGANVADSRVDETILRTTPAPESDPEPRGLHAPGSPMEDLLRLAEAMARRESPVLVHGESGTGKEVLARWLHERSLRRDGAFVAVNCAAISPSLVESELFGHCRGAFTHAITDRPGHIRQAEGGTLFLDEIGDMPLELQARFLRVLQEKTVRPVGGDAEIPVDFRLVCATHRELAAEVRAGRFRGDLYYRLRVLELQLPPLRDRPMDIPYLLRGFLSELDEEVDAEEARAAVAELPLAALQYPYPGNVRELRNVAERYAALRGIGGGWEQALEGCLRTDEQVMEPMPEYARASRTSRLTVSDVLAALETCGYHRGRAAVKLGVTRRTLQYHLAKLRRKEG